MHSAPLKIYGDMISPFVRTCFVAAHEAGLAEWVELVAADVAIAIESAPLAALSPIAQIPILVTPSGAALHDSRVIVDHLSEIGSRPLIPGGGAARHRILTLQAIGTGMADAAVAYRNEAVQRPEALHWHAWLDRQKQRVMRALDILNAHWQSELADTNAGSITVAVSLSYLDFRFGMWNWRDRRTALANFHERFNERPSMLATALPASSS